jgi:uncharacterized membrane protein YecN with MAPEG domain
MPHYTAIVTLLAVALYFFFATRVAAARGTFNVRHPATTGNLDFERIFRAHVNTLEWMPTFLIPLWLCALYLSDIGAAVLGLVWMWAAWCILSATSRPWRSGCPASSSRERRVCCCSLARPRALSCASQVHDRLVMRYDPIQSA